MLEVLAAAAVPQSLAELAARLKRSSSELFRVLDCLQRRGYIMRDALSGKYGLTLKLYSLAHTHRVVDKLLQAARAPMQMLTETFRQSCHLGVIERGRLLVIAQQESPEPVRLSIEVGGLFDPVRTASGRLLLACMDEPARKAVLADSPAACRFSRRAAADFAATLAAIRQRGISTAESETIDGVRDVAALVGRPEKGVTAALAISRLMRHGESGDQPALITGLRRAAAEITATLGLQS